MELGGGKWGPLKGKKYTHHVSSINGRLEVSERRGRSERKRILIPLYADLIIFT